MSKQHQVLEKVLVIIFLVEIFQKTSSKTHMATNLDFQEVHVSVWEPPGQNLLTSIKKLLLTEKVLFVPSSSACLGGSPDLFLLGVPFETLALDPDLREVQSFCSRMLGLKNVDSLEIHQDWCHEVLTLIRISSGSVLTERMKILFVPSSSASLPSMRGNLLDRAPVITVLTALSPRPSCPDLSSSVLPVGDAKVAEWRLESARAKMSEQEVTMMSGVLGKATLSPSPSVFSGTSAPSFIVGAPAWTRMLTWEHSLHLSNGQDSSITSPEGVEAPSQGAFVQVMVREIVLFECFSPFT